MQGMSESDKTNDGDERRKPQFWKCLLEKLEMEKPCLLILHF